MVTKKNLTDEQIALEAPVKGYQLEKLTVAIKDMKEEFGSKLNTVIAETKGTATKHDLDVEIKAHDEAIREYIRQEIRKMHLTYGPLKRGAIWLAATVITALIGMIAFQIKGS